MSVWSVVYLPKEKKVEKKTGNVQTVEKERPSEETKKPPTPEAPKIKLPSKAQMMKDPMKYIGEAVKAFQEVSTMVSENRGAIMQIAGHLKENDEKLAPLYSALEQRAKATQNQPQGALPQPQQMGVFDLLRLGAQSGILGAPQEDPFMKELKMEIFRTGLESMRYGSAINKGIAMRVSGAFGKEIEASIQKDLARVAQEAEAAAKV